MMHLRLRGNMTGELSLLDDIHPPDPGGYRPIIVDQSLTGKRTEGTPGTVFEDNNRRQFRHLEKMLPILNGLQRKPFHIQAWGLEQEKDGLQHGIPLKIQTKVVGTSCTTIT